MPRNKRKLGPSVPYPAFADSRPASLPSRVRISGSLARKAMKGLAVGKKHTFKVGGKVRSLASSDFDDSIEMDLDHCEECADENPTSLVKALKGRKRHMASGRYTA